jgi:hypothetical protein
MPRRAAKTTKRTPAKKTISPGAGAPVVASTGSGKTDTLLLAKRSQERTMFLTEVLGGATLARLLGVSRSQPTQWRKGAEQPGPVAARELVDLDHVLARALMLFPPRVAVDWLTSSNAFLNGARPLEVLKVRGSSEVIAALDAAESGALG